MGIIKALLKQIFPTSLLKKAFLSYNRVRILTLDRLLFPAYGEKKFHFNRYLKDYPFRLIKVVNTHFDPEVRGYMDQWEGWTQEEYVLKFEQPCRIEPRYGWAIIGLNRLLYPSQSNARASHVRKPYFWGMVAGKQVKKFDCLISLRDAGEENYFHFYNDILAKLFLLEEHGYSDSQIPVLISKKLYDKPYFQYFIHNSTLGNRQWVVQEDYYVESRTTYFCKPLTHRKAYFDQILNLFTYDERDQLVNRRVLLVRNAQRLRYLENEEAIANLVRKYDFEVIDADQLMLEEQMKLFAQTRYLIGIHGAGLTNMIYRRMGALSVLEIFPPPSLGYLPYHYVLLANMYGYRYDALIGTSGKGHFSGGFFLDVEALETKIKGLNLSGRTQ